jgi:hypothetical protein
MANDDRQSQQFIREVDEELRRAQLKSLWDRFAPLIIGVCLLVVAITAGYRGWVWWEARQAAQAGDRYLAAVQALEGENSAEGEAALAAIAGEGQGAYPALAQLRLAGHQAASGDTAAALTGFDAVSTDTATPRTLRDFARIRAALLALDTGDLAGARERAQPLDAPGNPWRHAAREVLGTAAYASGDLQSARDFFTAIQQDAETPSDIWVRSGMMVSLIDGQLAAPATEATPGAPSGAATDGAPTSATPAAAPAAGTAPAALPVPQNAEPVLTPMPGADATPAAVPAPTPPQPMPAAPEPDAPAAEAPAIRAAAPAATSQSPVSPSAPAAPPSTAPAAAPPAAAPAPPPSAPPPVIPPQ